MHTTSYALTGALLALLPVFVSPAAAQTEGRVSVGLSAGVIRPTDGSGTSAVLSPVVRLNPGDGWGLAGGVTWFDSDLVSGSDEEVASRIRIRPVMAGVSYTLRHDRLATSISMLAGYSFNSARDLRPGYTVDIEDSFAVRPGVSLTYTLARRVALIGFGGYLITRPDVTVRRFGVPIDESWNGDAVVLSAGLVYSLF